MKTIDYKIEDIDWWEQDATLVIGNIELYFQWDAKEEPTIEDALAYIKERINWIESKLYNVYS